MTVIRNWYLEINEVPLATHAWDIPDLSPLLDSYSVRGSDRRVPGAAGVLPYRRRRDVTVLTFALEVNGALTEDGEPVPVPLEGITGHMEYLNENLGLASDSGDGTVEARFVRAALPTLSTQVHFLGFKGSANLGEFDLRTTFDISVPGLWVPEGS